MTSDNIEQERARQLVESVLANTHDSLKWSWQVVMGFALAAAVQSTYTALTSRPPMATQDFILCLVIASLVFLPTFIRFFYGDNRYLDLHYSELRQWNNYDGYEQDLETKLSVTRRLIDVLLLLSHGILFALLALAIPKPELFFCFYAALLLTNCLWLHKVVNLNETVIATRRPSGVRQLLAGADIEQRTTRSPRRDAAPRFWIKNNAIHLVIFFSIYFAWDKTDNANRYIFMYAFVVACISNSIFDLYSQRDFYLPKLDQVYREARKEAGTIDPVRSEEPPLPL